jgi:hypothetical protein
MHSCREVPEGPPLDEEMGKRQSAEHAAGEAIAGSVDDPLLGECRWPPWLHVSRGSRALGVLTTDVRYGVPAGR